MTLYTQIDSNKRRSVILIALFIAVILALGYFIGYIYFGDSASGYGTLVVAAIFVVPFSLISYYSGDKIALSVSRAQKLTKQQWPEGYNLVENLSITAGFKKTPDIYIIEDNAINAFATGRDPDHASIALTRGAVTKLDKPELEGVIAHEMSHIKNYDIRLMTVVVIFVGVVALLSDLFIRASWFGGRRRSSNSNESGNLGAILAIIGIIFIILSPLIAQLIKAAISRKREFLADADGALLTRYSEGLARALEKIKAEHAPVRYATSATAHMYISNPLKESWMSRAFATHPPIDERIRLLREGAK